MYTPTIVKSSRRMSGGYSSSSSSSGYSNFRGNTQGLGYYQVLAGNSYEVPRLEVEWNYICQIFMTPLRVSGEGKLGDEMELPLVDPRDPNYDSDRHEAVVKISTLNSLIPIGSG